LSDAHHLPRVRVRRRVGVPGGGACGAVGSRSSVWRLGSCRPRSSLASVTRLMPALVASASWLSPFSSRSCAILAATRWVISDCRMVARMLQGGAGAVKVFVARSLQATSAELTENLGHDPVDVDTATVAVGGHPVIELASADKDLAARAIAWDGMRVVLKQIAQLPHAEARVRRECAKVEERVELGTDHDT